MNIAYFDCFAGISGDMILGALIDLGFPISKLKDSLASLPLTNYKLAFFQEQRMEIKGTRFLIHIDTPETTSRTFKDIRSMIEVSKLNSLVKEKSIQIFQCLAKSEAHIHQKNIEEVHFHEIGSTDSIIDIIGSVLGIQYFGIEEIISSPLALGSGFVKCKHGTLPLPAPATVEILKDIPVYGSGIEGELVTPTGAATIATMANSFGPLPPLRIKKVGYGVGEKKRPEIPNMLRIILGGKEKPLQQEKVTIIETNIDDMNPELYEHIMDILYDQGALDVFINPVQMKKNRPGVLLKVIALEKDKANLIRTMFQETTTLGIRCYTVERFKLSRRIEKIETPWGEVRIKKVERPDGREEASPEYEDCKRIAREKNIPLKRIYYEIFKAINL
jgi:hypothetical protein